MVDWRKKVFFLAGLIKIILQKGALDLCFLDCPKKMVR